MVDLPDVVEKYEERKKNTEGVFFFFAVRWEGSFHLRPGAQIVS